MLGRGFIIDNHPSDNELIRFCHICLLACANVSVCSFVTGIRWCRLAVYFLLMLLLLLWLHTQTHRLIKVPAPLGSTGT